MKDSQLNFIVDGSESSRRDHAVEDASGQPKTVTVTTRLIVVALVSLTGMTAFEVVKQLLFPNMTMWQSHVVTIVFSSVVTTAAAWFVLRTYRDMHERVIRELAERKRIETVLMESEERYHHIAANAPGMVYQFVLHPDGTVALTFVSEGCRDIYDMEPEAIIRNPMSVIDIIHPEDRPGYDLSVAESARSLAAWKWKGRMVLSSGKLKWIQGASRPERQADGSVIWDGLLMDVTESMEAKEALRETEEELRQAQKMEAIGRLAGGIAHDFNNLLAIVLLHSDLLLKRLAPGDPARRRAEEIKSASHRAASLTRQLLAFSRRQVLQPKVINLNEAVANMSNMLRRLIGEDINLLTVLEPELGRVKADPGQVEQVIMNLAVNARDAMPGGGKLIIETKNVFLSEEYASRHASVTSGQYIRLTVSDTGHGMDKETQERIFEPFFTTKDLGKGTGLGLSTVYGIVKQSGGDIWVYSEQGIGTTFKVYLPLSEDAAVEDKVNIKEPESRGTETVLLAEDEGMVRRVAREVLEMQGYRVLEARDVQEALAISATHDGLIHILLTDVVMPGMSGREIAAQILLSRSQMKVLYMSGYTDDAIVQHGVLDEGTSFIEKPFTSDALLCKLREVLDDRDKAAGATSLA